MKRLSCLIAVVVALAAWAMVAPAPAQVTNIPANQLPAFTGDCTTVAGAVANTCTKINGVDQTTAWTAYTPTVACGTGSLGTNTPTGRWKALGKTIHFQAQVAITTNSTCAANLQIGLPTTAGSGKYTVVGYETAVTGKLIYGEIGAGVTSANVQYYDNTYPGGNGTAPAISGVYESN